MTPIDFPSLVSILLQAAAEIYSLLTWPGIFLLDSNKIDLELQKNAFKGRGCGSVGSSYVA